MRGSVVMHITNTEVYLGVCLVDVDRVTMFYEFCTVSHLRAVR